ncbi:MAG: TPM domain-containing protein [Planctomycetaceae bacterium]|nr:TPM domain-containing protein [Planctomycetaceae bacterium]
MLRQFARYSLPLCLLVGLMVAQVEAAGVRDGAGLFSTSTVRKVDAELDRLEKRAHVDVVIETIDSIPGLGSNPSREVKQRAIEDLAERRAKEVGHEGVYLLISKNDRVFSKLLVRERLDALMPRHERLAVRDALQSAFKAGNFDEGLLNATEIIKRSFSGVPVEPRAVRDLPAGQRAGAQHARFGVGTLLMIGLGIFGILLLLRLLGGLFRGGSAGYPPQMGMGGMPRPGMGPGFGGPGGGYGYGAPRGGGFFSGMLGGLGGALAGNWLYDQFSGRHGGHTDYASTAAPDTTVPETSGSQSPDSGAFVGGDDDGPGGTSWDDSGSSGSGGDWAGADGGGGWGGGDGGGDWGGGGGDWGGGGDGGGW